MKTLTWPFRLIAFVLWFVGALVSSNVAVIKDNLTPGQNSTTGIARFPTECRTDGEITLLAALITLTPGTLTLGTETTEDGRRVLFVHGLYCATADDLRQELRDMQDRMLRAVRRLGVDQ